MIAAHYHKVRLDVELIVNAVLISPTLYLTFTPRNDMGTEWNPQIAMVHLDLINMSIPVLVGTGGHKMVEIKDPSLDHRILTAV